MTNTPEYSEYVRLQTETYRSFESDSAAWTAAMINALRSLFPGSIKRKTVLDVACGDGTQLKWFRSRGARVAGVELSPEKAARAREQSGAPVFELDFHDLSPIDTNSIDIVFSSHSLEHAYQPHKVVRELYRVLKPGGKLYVILPFPDTGPDSAHGGKYELGTTINDSGAAVQVFFAKLGFTINEVTFSSEREPEIWLVMTKEA